MALELAITLTESKDSKTITLVDTTGVYNSITNPGGYGASQDPVGERSTTDISSSRIILTEFSGSPTATQELDQAAAGDLADGSTPSFPITMSFFSSVGAKFNSTVYKVDYQVDFTLPSFIDATFDSNIIVADTAGDFAGAKYITIVDGDNTFKYEILSVIGSNITIDSVFEGTTDTYYNCLVTYEVTAYCPIKNVINGCIQSRIAKLSCSSCGCHSNSIEQLTEAMALYFSIPINTAAGKYNHVVDTLNCLYKYCTSNDCGCD